MCCAHANKDTIKVCASFGTTSMLAFILLWVAGTSAGAVSVLDRRSSCRARQRRCPAKALSSVAHSMPRGRSTRCPSFCAQQSRSSRLDAQPQPLNRHASGMQTLASEGVRGLFRGMAAPLATVALFNAVLFATRGQMERLLAHPDGRRHQSQSRQDHPAVVDRSNVSSCGQGFSATSVNLSRVKHIHALGQTKGVQKVLKAGCGGVQARS